MNIGTGVCGSDCFRSERPVLELESKPDWKNNNVKLKHAHSIFFANVVQNHSGPRLRRTVEVEKEGTPYKYINERETHTV
jgi:hypothetical protein